MSTNEADHQPHVAVEDEYVEDLSEDAVPEHKSGVRVDPAAAMQTAKFSKGDTVHMSQVIGGRRIKGIFQIHRLQYNAQKAFIEYQLMEPLTLTLYKDGVWIREKDLRRDR